jgi:hypothetical protein
MQLRIWLRGIRILNCLCGGLVISLQAWLLIELMQTASTWQFMLQMWAPLFLMYTVDDG